MTDVNNRAAEPSAADQQEFDGTAKLSPSVKDAWNRGEAAPEPKKQEAAPADKSEETTSVVEDDPETKSAAEAETAQKPQDKDKPQHARKPSAEAEIARLKRELRESQERLRKREVAAEPPKDATKPEPKPAAKAEAPKRPNPFKWTGTEDEYEAAMDAYDKYQREQSVRDAFRQHAQQQQAQELQGKLAEAQTRYGADSTTTRILPTADTIFKDQQIPAAVKAMIDDSPVLVDLLYTLGDGAKLNQFLETARTKPGLALREIATLEQLIQEELGKASGKGKDAKAKAAEGKDSGKTDEEEMDEFNEAADEEEETPVVPVTRAPKPPSEVGGRGAPGEDSLVAAAQAAGKGGTAKLSRQFKEEANRRYLARAK